MNKQGELKPCPFCGGEAKYVDRTDVGREYCAVVCEANCDSMDKDQGWTTEKDAAMAWNHRADTDVLAMCREALELADALLDHANVAAPEVAKALAKITALKGDG